MTTKIEIPPLDPETFLMKLNSLRHISDILQELSEKWPDERIHEKVMMQALVILLECELDRHRPPMVEKVKDQEEADDGSS